MMSYESVRHDMGLYPVEDHGFSDVDGLFPKLKQPYSCDSLDLNENRLFKPKAVKLAVRW